MASKTTVRMEQFPGAMAALLKRMYQHNNEAVLTEVNALPFNAELRAKASFGGYMNVISGNLRRAITGFSRQSGRFWTVGLSNEMAYAAIQHEGGTIPPHEIRPRFAKALFWPGADHPVAKVDHPGGTIKAKPFMADPLKAEAGKMMDRLINKIGFGDG